MYENERNSLENAVAEEREMSTLNTHVILNNDRQQSCSSSFNAQRNDPLSVRSASTYRSLRRTYPMENPSQEITVNNGITLELDDDQIEIDADESPPVDESLFFDNLECWDNHCVNGAKLKLAITSIIEPVEKKLLLHMEKTGNLPNACRSEGLRNIAYIWASYRGLLHLLPTLEEAGARYDYVEPRTGMNAILVASLGDKAACVDYLIVKGADVNYENSLTRYTPLHFAALGNSWHAAATLLDHGAKLNYVCQEMVEPILHNAVRAKAMETIKLLLERGASVVENNHLGQTPLHVACFIQSIPCVELLLNSTAVDAPGININAVDREHRTPLHFAVMSIDSSVELVQLLLQRGASVNAIDRGGFTPLHIAALTEQSHCVDALIWAGADISATTCTGTSALNIILKKIPESLQVFRQRLDASIRLIRPVAHNREFEMRFNFDILLPSNNQCETNFIYTFVQEHQGKHLLLHPLVMAFLYLKWKRIRRLYWLRIIYYIVMVICMTMYVLTQKCYNHDDEAHNSTMCAKKSFFYRRSIIKIEWYLLLTLVCISALRKIYSCKAHKSKLRYFYDIYNLLDITVIASVFVISFIYTGQTYSWQNYVGAFATLCAWSNLMLMVGQLPAFGAYVAMFTQIQIEFAKLLLAYSGLLIGFTISFCVIFSNKLAFGNPLTGLIKILAMMAGEVDFNGFIDQENELDFYELISQKDEFNFDGLIGPTNKSSTDSYVTYPLPVCTQILFTLFIIFVTVILMNLLVGIAVHDIQGLKEHAGLTKLRRQTDMILFFERVYNAIPYILQQWLLNLKCIMNTENKKRILVVKPHNPLEKRLPKDIITAAYEIAKKNIHTFVNDDANLCDAAVWSRQQQNEEFANDVLRTAIEKLIVMMNVNEDAVKSLRTQILEMSKMLETVVTTLAKEEHS